jgi:hypothetical protein
MIVDDKYFQGHFSGGAQSVSLRNVEACAKWTLVLLWQDKLAGVASRPLRGSAPL